MTYDKTPTARLQPHGRVIDTSKGARHDFLLYKHSKVGLPDEAECFADSGYQGLTQLHVRVQTPFKKPKGSALIEIERAFDKQFTQERVVFERIIRHLKIFRLLSGYYRNQELSLRCALI